MSYQSFIEETRKQCETLRSEASNLYVEPPQVNLSSEVDTFCESLQFVDDDERERRLRDFIRPSVEHEVEKWESQFSHAQSSLVRLHDLIDDVDREKRNLEINIETLNQDKSEKRIKHASVEKKLDTVKADTVNSKPLTAYSKFSYQMFIVGTLIIAVLTAWYYLTTQLQIQFSQDPDIIPGSDGKFPGTIEFLKYKPESLIYGLGVVMFLLAGKVISVIYEKINYNNIFFITCSVLALMAVFSSIYLVSSVSSKTSDLTSIINSPPELGPVQRAACSQPNATGEACEPYRAWIEQRDSIQSSISGTRFFMTIVILCSEVLLGSIAWMLAAEYHEKRMGESNTLSKRKKLLEADIGKSGSSIKEIDNELASLNGYKGDLETIASQLLSLRGSLPTREYITKQKSILIDQQIQKGMSSLLQKKHGWETDARSSS